MLQTSGSDITFPEVKVIKRARWRKAYQYILQAKYEGPVLFPNDIVDTDLGAVAVDVVEFPRVVTLRTLAPTRMEDELITGNLLIRDIRFVIIP